MIGSVSGIEKWDGRERGWKANLPVRPQMPNFEPGGMVRVMLLKAGGRSDLRIDVSSDASRIEENSPI